ncbi:hypothetical protein [Streptacidiphilus pinicola]|uniref:hypothetical protein n=1 Tax=Streptacidiphilus pinicola TaxID=2219663 RepID=UPI001057956E|nr:hypothetical protein [Streptacidiphilus pinicola]
MPELNRFELLCRPFAQGPLDKTHALHELALDAHQQAPPQGIQPHEAEPAAARGAPVVDLMAAPKASNAGMQAQREAAAAPANKTALKKRTPRRAG